MGSCSFKYSGLLGVRQIGGCVWLEQGLLLMLSRCPACRLYRSFFIRIYQEEDSSSSKWRCPPPEVPLTRSDGLEECQWVPLVTWVAMVNSLIWSS